MHKDIVVEVIGRREAFVWSEGDYFVIRTGKYVSEFIEALKRTVPADERDYDPETLCWRVSRPYRTQVTELLRRYFSEVYYLSETDSKSREAVLHLLCSRHKPVAPHVMLRRRVL